MVKLFVHIPKNGGMTIRKNQFFRGKILLASKGRHVSDEYTDELLRTMDAQGDHHGNEHARWRDWSEPLREAYQAFAIVRNPWTRTVSRYLFAKKVIEVEKKVPRTYADVSSFKAFLEERHKWGDVPYMWHRAVRGWFPQYDYVTYEDELKCDILRLESLEEDITKYFKIPWNANFNLKSRNVTEMTDKSYLSFYDDDTIQIVADWYKKDIDFFGFDVDSSAKKNIWNRNYD